MKLILAPTDFSKTARNAINYAAEVAKRTKSKLVLLHAYHPPVPITVGLAEAAILTPLPADVEKNSLRRLKKIRYDLITKHGRRLEVEINCQNGLAVDIITEYAKTNKTDLVVMGTHGAGYLEEKLLGSVTSELIKNLPNPVLSVASNVKFKNIKKIVLATDYRLLESADALDILKDLANLSRSHIYILNITGKADELPTVSQAVQGLKLEHIFEAYDHSFHSAINKDVVNGINEFAESRSINMIVMFPHRRSFLQSIFNKSNSKAMAFHTGVPLLTIRS